MKKRKFIVSCFILLLLFAVFYSFPYMVKFNYNRSKELKDLYFLCKVSVFYNKDDFAIEYIPQLITKDENQSFIDDFQRDELLFEYLTSMLELGDFNEQQSALGKCFVLFSNIETAIPYSTNFIFSYYDQSKDLEKSKLLFEILLDASNDMDFEYKNGIYSKYIFFLLKVEDYESVQKVRADRIEFLKSNGVDIWSEDMQSEYLGDGVILEQSEQSNNQ